LACLNACTPVTNIPERGSGSPFASASSTAIQEASGSNPNLERALSFTSPCLPEDTPPAAGSRILIVEDNEADVYLIVSAIRASGIAAVLDVAKDGERAVRVINEADRDETNVAACPEMVILDINLPRRPGDEVLRSIRASRRCADIPVIAVSTSNSERDREQMIRLGANGYFNKPSSYEAFMTLGDMVKDLLTSRAK
jgi:CheY-like chemotaxis protein